MTIVCIGEAIVDLVCERRIGSPDEADSFVPHPGGAVANVAVAIARAGGESALLGGVGDDIWGRWLRERLSEAGVHVGWIASVTELDSPIAVITFDLQGEPTFQVYGAAIEPTMRASARHIDEALDEAEALVFGSNTLVGAQEREVTLRARRGALDRQLPILYDPNIRPGRWEKLDSALTFCREMCDGSFVVKANAAEAMTMTGTSDPVAAADGLCALGAELGIVTMGADGAVMRGAVEAEAGAPEVEVVVPLGAGDAFMGALAAGLSRVGWDPARAAETLPDAVEAGARACTAWGAQ